MRKYIRSETIHVQKIFFFLVRMRMSKFRCYPNPAGSLRRLLCYIRQQYRTRNPSKPAHPFEGNDPPSRRHKEVKDDRTQKKKEIKIQKGGEREREWVYIYACVCGSKKVK